MKCSLMVWVGGVALIDLLRLCGGKGREERVLRHWAVVTFNVIETQAGAVLVALFISGSLWQADGVGLMWVASLAQLNTLRPQMQRRDTGESQGRPDYERLYCRLDLVKMALGLLVLVLPW